MSAVTRWELVAYALSALLALSALFVLPVVRAVDPTLAAAFSRADDSITKYASVRRAAGTDAGEIPRSTDPWGRPWRWYQDSYYSVGPDGVDARGGGDDITLDAIFTHPVRSVLPRDLRRNPRATLLILGGLLALWTLLTRQTLRAPRGPLVLELRRAAIVVAVPAIVGAYWAFSVGARLDERVMSGAGGVVLLPPATALKLTWALACYLPGLAWRLSRPRAESPG